MSSHLHRLLHEDGTLKDGNARDDEHRAVRCGDVVRIQRVEGLEVVAYQDGDRVGLWRSENTLVPRENLEIIELVDDDMHRTWVARYAATLSQPGRAKVLEKYGYILNGLVALRAQDI